MQYFPSMFAIPSGHCVYSCVCEELDEEDVEEDVEDDCDVDPDEEATAAGINDGSP